MSRLYEVVEIQEEIPKFLIVGESEIAISLAKNLLDGEAQVFLLGLKKSGLQHENLYELVLANLKNINRQIGHVFFEKEPPLEIDNFLHQELPHAHFFYLNPKAIRQNSVMFFAPLVFGPNIIDDSFGYLARVTRDLLEKQVLYFPENIEDLIQPIYFQDVALIIEKKMFLAHEPQKILLQSKKNLSLITFLGALKSKLTQDIETAYLNEKLILRLPKIDSVELGHTPHLQGVAETASWLNKKIIIKPKIEPRIQNHEQRKNNNQEEIITPPELPRQIPTTQSFDGSNFELSDHFIKRSLHDNLNYLKKNRLVEQKESTVKKVKMQEQKMAFSLNKKRRHLANIISRVKGAPRFLISQIKKAPWKQINEKNRGVMRVISRVFLAVGGLMFAIALPLVIFEISFLFSLFSLRASIQDLSNFKLEPAKTNLLRSQKAFEFAWGMHRNFISRYDELLKNKKAYGNLESLLALESNPLEIVKNTILAADDLSLSLPLLINKSGEGAHKNLEKTAADLIEVQLSLSRTIAALKNNVPSLPFILQSKQKEYYDSLKKLPQIYALVKNTNSFMSRLPVILGAHRPMTYLIVLQNNMELRGGGGFIGSFALVSFEKEKLVNLEIQDVYSADGQLKGHIAPPPEILHFLGQPNWYLRDSNISPDFPTNAKKIIWFFEKETKVFLDGVIAIDLNLIEQLLDATGPLYLPDVKETITSGNFFEKVESRAEKEFFPGSTQKKDFLTQVAQNLTTKLLGLKNHELSAVLQSLPNSVSARHLQVYFSDESLQKSIQTFNLTGEIKKTKNDFLMLAENNYGANKANFFLKREIYHQINLNAKGEAEHKLRIKYENTAPSDIYPAGPYKAYVKVYVPENSYFQDLDYQNKTPKISEFLNEYILAETEKNEQLVLNGLEFEKTYFGTLINVKVGETEELVFSWNSPAVFAKNKYHYYFQKQPGVGKDNYHLQISFPKNLQVSSSMLSSLAAEGKLEYNLSTKEDIDLKLIFK